MADQQPIKVMNNRLILAGNGSGELIMDYRKIGNEIKVDRKGQLCNPYSMLSKRKNRIKMGLTGFEPVTSAV